MRNLISYTGLTAADFCEMNIDSGAILIACMKRVKRMKRHCNEKSSMSKELECSN